MIVGISLHNSEKGSNTKERAIAKKGAIAQKGVLIVDNLFDIKYLQLQSFKISHQHSSEGRLNFLSKIYVP